MRPSLECPVCGSCTLPAHTRGRHDRNGNFIDHGEACRCRHCSWMWIEHGGEADALRCRACDAQLYVRVPDDGAAPYLMGAANYAEMQQVETLDARVRFLEDAIVRFCADHACAYEGWKARLSTAPLFEIATAVKRVRT